MEIELKFRNRSVLYKTNEDAVIVKELRIIRIQLEKINDKYQNNSKENWSFFKRISEDLNEFWLVRLCTAVGSVAILFAAWTFYQDSTKRRADYIFNAWQVIGSTSSGNAGRKDAIEYLNTSDCWFGAGMDSFSWPVQKLGDWLASRCAFSWIIGIGGESESPKKRTVLNSINISSSDEEKYTVIDGIRLRGVNFKNAVFDRSYWVDGLIANSDLLYTNGKGVLFEKIRILNSHISGNWACSSWNKLIFHIVTMYRVDLKNSVIDELNMEGVIAAGVNLSNSELYSPLIFASRLALDMSRSKLLFGKIALTDISDTTFDKSDLTGTMFHNVAFTRVSMRDTNLSGVEFTGLVTFTNVNTEGSFYCKGMPKPILPKDYQGAAPEEVECKRSEREKGRISYINRNYNTYPYAVISTKKSSNKEEEAECKILKSIGELRKNDDIQRAYYGHRKFVASLEREGLSIDAEERHNQTIYGTDMSKDEWIKQITK